MAEPPVSGCAEPGFRALVCVTAGQWMAPSFAADRCWVSLPPSARRLPTADVRDDRPGRGGREPSAVYRVLDRAGRLFRWNRRPWKNGTAFGAAAGAARALADRHLLPQHRLDVLLGALGARRGEAIVHWNLRGRVRLRGKIGYVTPNDFLAGTQRAIPAARDQKLGRACELRALPRATKAIA